MAVSASVYIFTEYRCVHECVQFTLSNLLSRCTHLEGFDTQFLTVFPRMLPHVHLEQAHREHVKTADQLALMGLHIKFSEKWKPYAHAMSRFATKCENVKFLILDKDVKSVDLWPIVSIDFLDQFPALEGIEVRGFEFRYRMQHVVAKMSHLTTVAVNPESLKHVAEFIKQVSVELGSSLECFGVYITNDRSDIFEEIGRCAKRFTRVSRVIFHTRVEMDSDDWSHPLKKICKLFVKVDDFPNVERVELLVYSPVFKQLGVKELADKVRFDLYVLCDEMAVHCVSKCFVSNRSTMLECCR